MNVEFKFTCYTGKIDALYQTVQKDSNDNNESGPKNGTRVICSIMSEYDDPPTSSDMHNSNGEEYEIPVIVSTNSHPTEVRLYLVGCVEFILADQDKMSI